MNKFAPLVLAVLIALAGIQIWSSRGGESVRAGDGIVSDEDLRKDTTTTLSQRTFVTLAPLPETSATTVRIRRAAVAQATPAPTQPDGENQEPPADPDGEGENPPGDPDGETPETTEPEPPATDPPETDPPEPTDPPATDPPETDPPATDPPETDPPATDPPEENDGGNNGDDANNNGNNNGRPNQGGQGPDA